MATNALRGKMCSELKFYKLNCVYDLSLLKKGQPATFKQESFALLICKTNWRIERSSYWQKYLNRVKFQDLVIITNI